MVEPQLPNFLYHFNEDEDPVPCFAMTNPYEAILTHDPVRTCVCVCVLALTCYTPFNHPLTLIHHLMKELTSGIFKVQVRHIFLKWAIGPLCLTDQVIQFVHNPLV